MEINSIINSNPTNPSLSDGDMSLEHFSDWSRSDKMALFTPNSNADEVVNQDSQQEATLERGSYRN
ncbi:14312_t:CDS:2 [Cetraspora pellucida]|uniref:14312_t:CDS:1 n=1 Tax=Cetraspora pellucida TaxID=1433469 RepID=A0ACA9KG53_9GLOM|nr:14312_t:CDS:2 [Cetraspora pellucida]